MVNKHIQKLCIIKYQLNLIELFVSHYKIKQIPFIVKINEKISYHYYTPPPNHTHSTYVEIFDEKYKLDQS